MKQFKKIQAFVLAVILVVSCIVPAGAENVGSKYYDERYMVPAAAEGEELTTKGHAVEMSMERARMSKQVELSFKDAAAANGAYREQLSARGKALFDFMAGLSATAIKGGEKNKEGYFLLNANVPGAMNVVVPGSLRGDIFYYTAEGQKAFEELEKDLYASIGALRYDRPDLFWTMNMWTAYSYTITADRMTITNVKIGFSMDFGNEQEIYDMSWENAQLIADEAKKRGNVVGQIQFVHDALSEINSYADNADPKVSLFPFMAYSALIAGDNYYPVCEGYSRAMNMVLKLLDIPCVVVVSKEHMWNNVKLDNGIWYNLDLTWDDSEDEKGCYDYFLVGSDTVVDGYPFKVSHQELDISTSTPTETDYGIRFDYPQKSATAYSTSGLTFDETITEFVAQLEVLFVDVSRKAWYYDAVNYVNERELFNGTSAMAFSPGIPMNRAMFAQVLVNHVSNYDKYTGAQIFADVANDAWYYDVVNWAYSNDIVTGISATAYGPNNPITREQMALMLYKYAEKTGTNMEVTGSKHLAFTDMKDVSDWAEDAIIWAVDRGIINGMTSTTIGPKGTAQRSQVAAIFKNADGILGDELGAEPEAADAEDTDAESSEEE